MNDILYLLLDTWLCDSSFDSSSIFSSYFILVQVFIVALKHATLQHVW